MKENHIITLGDFANFVQSLVKGPASTYEKSLEEYLRSLWSLIEEQREQTPSYALFGYLLSEAFTRKPMQFNENWLSYEKPPFETGRDDLSTFEDLQAMILYQIADLHRMESKAILDKSAFELWLGVDSPTGYTWYNFHPNTFLECASASLAKDSGLIECDWGFLAIFLWVGRIYE
jgi:hypothetical protein